VQVLVDVNWRPVFFKDPEAAPAVIKPYVEQADIVKVTEEEAEWLWGVPGDEALEDAEKVLLNQDILSNTPSRTRAAEFHAVDEAPDRLSLEPQALKAPTPAC